MRIHHVRRFSHGTIDPGLPAIIRINACLPACLPKHCNTCLAGIVLLLGPHCKSDAVNRPYGRQNKSTLTLHCTHMLLYTTIYRLHLLPQTAAVPSCNHYMNIQPLHCESSP